MSLRLIDFSEEEKNSPPDSMKYLSQNVATDVLACIVC